MYFIHSCYVKVKEQDIITSYSKFNSSKFISSVKKDNIFAYQFHPEKCKNGFKFTNQLKINQKLRNLISKCPPFLSFPEMRRSEIIN